jgi:hypothetical protein
MVTMGSATTTIAPQTSFNRQSVNRTAKGHSNRLKKNMASKKASNLRAYFAVPESFVGIFGFDTSRSRFKNSVFFSIENHLADLLPPPCRATGLK